MSTAPVRVRVFKGDGMWEFRCLSCVDYGGGGPNWFGAFYGSQIHLRHHKLGLVTWAQR